jgi:hypothetical protein
MEPEDRRSAANGHILIGGTGRAGTTLLVQWFTVMGFDTGFTVEEALARIDPISHAGLEHSLSRTLEVGAPLPYVAKSPWFGANLAGYLDSGQLRCKAAIVPLRSLSDAAESRRNVSRLAEDAGLDPNKHPGGVLGGSLGGAGAVRKQEQRLARRFYQLIHTLVTREVDLYFLSFPEFARGLQDPYARLQPLLEVHGVGSEEAAAALKRVVRPELIHDFAAGDSSR